MKIQITIGENNSALSVAVQHVLFAHGYKWYTGRPAPAPEPEHTDKRYLFAADAGYKDITWSNDVSGYSKPDAFFDPRTEPISRLIEWLKPVPVKVQINDRYVAEVDRSRKIVKVGCSEFTFERVQALAAALYESVL